MRHLARGTVRWRLTLLYGGLFAVAGLGLLGFTYVLAATQFPQRFTAHGPTPTGGSALVTISSHAASSTTVGAERADFLHQLVVQSGLALATMIVVAVGLGWLVAGRILRPLRAMTAATRQISEASLHQRLAMVGPADELKDLGDTIDGLLGRLESAFDAQRRFVANASHELRTPLTLGRTMLQVALDDPDLTLDGLRATCREVLQAGEEQERLIDALLTLARSQRGLDRRELFDLAVVAGEVLRSHEREAAARRVRVEATFCPAPVAGDARLVERLVSNLLDNALRYNVPGGRLQLTAVSRVGRATVRVTNTGPRVPDGQVERLLQPFQRLDAHRGVEREGLGLGLSIVVAIAGAHGAALSAVPGLDGGLDVTVSFPTTGHQPDSVQPDPDGT